MRLPVLAELSLGSSHKRVRLVFHEKSLHQAVVSPSWYCDCVASSPSFSYVRQVSVEWRTFSALLACGARRESRVYFWSSAAGGVLEVCCAFIMTRSTWSWESVRARTHTHTHTHICTLTRADSGVNTRIWGVYVNAVSGSESVSVITTPLLRFPSTYFPVLFVSRCFFVECMLCVAVRTKK